MYLGGLRTALHVGQIVELSEAQAHYIVNVMRLRDGSPVRVFDGASGEFLATVSGAASTGGGRSGKGKKRSGSGGGRAAEKKAVLRVEHVTREQSGGSVLGVAASGFDGKEEHQTATAPDVYLMFAPIRKQRLKILVEKAVEIGASCLIPVLTARTQKSAIEDGAAGSLAKLRLTAIEAAEQCERMIVPRIESTPVPLASLLNEWPKHIQRHDSSTTTKHSSFTFVWSEHVTGVTNASDGSNRDNGKEDEQGNLRVDRKQVAGDPATTTVTSDEQLPAVIFVCKERAADAPPLLDALAQFALERERRQQRLANAGNDNSSYSSDIISSAIFVGPEGGFAPEEIDAMAACSFVRFVSLGPTVLRAETAAMYALSCWSAFWAATDRPP